MSVIKILLLVMAILAMIGIWIGVVVFSSLRDIDIELDNDDPDIMTGIGDTGTYFIDVI